MNTEYCAPFLALIFTSAAVTRDGRRGLAGTVPGARGHTGMAPLRCLRRLHLRCPPRCDEPDNILRQGVVSIAKSGNNCVATDACACPDAPCLESSCANPLASAYVSVQSIISVSGLWRGQRPGCRKALQRHQLAMGAASRAFVVFFEPLHPLPTGDRRGQRDEPSGGCCSCLGTQSPHLLRRALPGRC